MILTYVRLLELIQSNVVVNSDPSRVNAASLDITLGSTIFVEQESRGKHVVDLSDRKQHVNFREVEIPDDGYTLWPGEFILASTREIFNLPDNISAKYFLNSSLARNGLEHSEAGWCDAGWHGSTLTLELFNVTRLHYLKIKRGMKCGQMVFFNHETVPEEASYRTKGSYNNTVGTCAAKP